MIIDEFLPAPLYKRLKTHSLHAEFKDYQNEVDNVVYPLICTHIPIEISDAILGNIEHKTGQKIKHHTMFMRKMPKGMVVPHMVHNDISMGRYSLMLYMNEFYWYGTGLFRHRETGITYAPEKQEYVDILRKDMNNKEKWVMYNHVIGQSNRAFIFDAGLMHAALPTDGFGSTPEDTRTVLTCFFS